MVCMSIQVLSDELISQIAAGEVVERPSSVVKELIENALDAAASVITVRIEDSGQKLIEVSDNGRGISGEELKVAVRRHATSKIRQVDDLFHIQTLGFRGEALASIAAISRFTLTSKTNQDTVGGKIVIDGGKVISVIQTGVPEGTVVSVKDLFFNVPARLAFLKNPVTEKNQINALVFRYALAYPQVRWSLTQDQRPILRSSGNGDHREILAAMYGVGVSKELIEVRLEEADQRVYGYVSPAQVTRSNRREMTFFINGRWVQDAGLSAALYKAYEGYLPPGRYPIGALFIEIPLESVDVNVHPAKAEVRFQQPSQVFSLVQRAVRRAFLAYTPIDQAREEIWRDTGPGASVSFGSRNFSVNSSHDIDPAWTIAGSVKGEDIEPMNPNQAAMMPEVMGLLRLIGKLQQRYLLVEGPDGLYLIDEKAAEERILYEKFLRQIEAGSIVTGPLEKAFTVDFQYSDAEGMIDALSSVGFTIEPFGPSLVKITHTPILLNGFDTKAIVQGLISDYPSKSFVTEEERTQWLLQRLAFHTAGEFDTGNDVKQQNQLLSELQMCQSPRQTPEGRATMIHLSLELLNRQFDRS
jgi:DNA mismatch repair protein MutL